MFPKLESVFDDDYKRSNFKICRFLWRVSRHCKAFLDRRDFRSTNLMELQKDCHQLIPGQSVVDKCQITIRKFIWCPNDVKYVSCAFLASTNWTFQSTLLRNNFKIAYFWLSMKPVRDLVLVKMSSNNWGCWPLWNSGIYLAHIMSTWVCLLLILACKYLTSVCFYWLGFISLCKATDVV